MNYRIIGIAGNGTITSFVEVLLRKELEITNLVW
jgi:hypothetical protein